MFVGELLKSYDIIDLYGQTVIPEYQTYYTKVMRRMRNMDADYMPHNHKNHPKYELIPLREIKDAAPTYIIALCREKSSETSK